MSPPDPLFVPERSAAVPTDTTRKSQMKIVAESPNLAEQIRRRAFELYEARGREEGGELEDWFRAEAEISRMIAKAAA
jgi:DUF2934 family protein